MDSFRAIVRRLRPFCFGLLVAFFASLSVAPGAVFASSNPSYDSAMAACTAYLPTANAAAAQYGWFTVGGCQSFSGYVGITETPTGAGAAVGYPAYNCSTEGACYAAFEFSGAPPNQSPPVNPCTLIPSATIPVSGPAPYQNGQAFPELSPSSAGPQVSCSVVATVIGTPIHDPNSGQWTSFVSFVPSGNLANGTGVTDSNGSAPNPQPTIPAMPMVNVTAPPQVCGGGSCYDAVSNQFQAVGADGTLYDVPMANATTPTGGCSGGSGGAMCAGSPLAPTPPATLVPDPPSQVNASDTYPVANPSTSATQNVQVTTYGAPGMPPPSSGAQAGDSAPSKGAGTGTGPASSSTAAGTGDYAGGNGCKTPPVCSGIGPWH